MKKLLFSQSIFLLNDAFVYITYNSAVPGRKILIAIISLKYPFRCIAMQMTVPFYGRA